jgi:hypothetical protein
MKRYPAISKSQLAQRAYEEGHKVCWKEAKVLQFQRNTIYRKYRSHVW